MDKHISFDVSELQEGAVQEKLERAVKQVMLNIQDPNTEFKPKRKVTIEFEFEANERRDVIDTNVTVKTKLAPEISVGTTVITGRDENTGFIVAKELKSGIPGQTYIDDSGDLKSDTGESIDEVEKKENNMVDFGANFSKRNQN